VNPDDEAFRLLDAGQGYAGDETSLCERECDCMDDCLGEDDGASWSESASAWVVTEYGFEEKGLL